MSTAEADLGKISGYVNTHRKAGHNDPSSDRFEDYLTDLQTQVFDAHRVIYAYRPPATIDERLSFIVSNIAAIAAELGTLVSQIADQTNDAVNAAAARVITALGDVAALKQAVADAQAAAAAAADAQAAAEANAAASEAARAQAAADLDTANANLATVQAALDAALADQAADATTLTGTIATADSIAPVSPV